MKLLIILTIAVLGSNQMAYAKAACGATSETRLSAQTKAPAQPGEESDKKGAR